MCPATRSAENEGEARLKRLRYRAWHRGTREMDLILGPFADSCAPDMDETGLAAFERLLDLPDGELQDLIMSGNDAPPLALLRAFHGMKAGK